MASFEDTLASIPGYGGYLAKRKMNEDDGTGDLRKLSALMSLSEMAQKTKQASLARESTDKYLATLGDGPDAQTMRAYGQINPSGLLETLVKQKMEQDLLASESARLGLNQPQPQAPQVLTGEEPFAAKSGDMAGLSGFQGNPQELMMQIAKSNASPQDKQMMFSQLQEQMRGTGQQSQQPQSEMPPMPAQFAGITREMALNMQRSPVKSLQLQGKQVGDWYEKRDMLEQQGQQREDMLRLAASLKPPPQPQRPVEVMKLDGSGTEYVTPEESYGRKPPGAASKGISNIDARSIDRSAKASEAANAALQFLDQADLLYSKYESDLTQPIMGPVNRVASAVLPGSTKAAEDYEHGMQIAKDLGVIKLGLIGGSDTERELQVAIDTSPSPDKTVGTNKKIIANQRKAIEILQEEPDFKTDWVSKYGSLNSLDTNGKGYGAAWRKYQRENFNDKVPSESLKPADIREPSNDAGLVKVKSVNEAMKLKRGTRFIDPNGVERVRP